MREEAKGHGREMDRARIGRSSTVATGRASSLGGEGIVGDDDDSGESGGGGLEVVGRDADEKEAGWVGAKAKVVPEHELDEAVRNVVSEKDEVLDLDPDDGSGGVRRGGWTGAGADEEFFDNDQLAELNVRLGFVICVMGVVYRVVCVWPDYQPLTSCTLPLQ